MNPFLHFLIFCFLFASSQSFNCPSGSDRVPNENTCMYAIKEPKFYYDVTHECQLLGGIAAKITNAFENALLSEMIRQKLGSSIPFIGVQRKEDGSWVYADGTTLTYQNWAPNEPKNAMNCAFMDPQTAKWMTSECSVARPYFCSINGDDFQCPRDWVYNALTDYCYKLQNFTYPDSVHWQLYNWTTAEADCKRMGAHLVSIHSKIEENFIYDLIYVNVRDLNDVAPNNDTCEYGKWVWIGLDGDGTLQNSKWTDGSPMDYQAPYFIDGERFWVMCHDDSCQCEVWSYSYNTATWPRFVCKMPPVQSDQ